SVNSHEHGTAAGAMRQCGATSDNGADKRSTSAAGPWNNAPLGAGNGFTTGALSRANDVTVRDANGLDLGASTVSGNLKVTTAGEITRGRAGKANGAGKSATFAAEAAKNITLGAANDFTSEAVSSGSDVTAGHVNRGDVGSA